MINLTYYVLNPNVDFRENDVKITTDSCEIFDVCCCGDLTPAYAFMSLV